MYRHLIFNAIALSALAVTLGAIGDTDTLAGYAMRGAIFDTFALVKVLWAMVA